MTYEHWASTQIRNKLMFPHLLIYPTTFKGSQVKCHNMWGKYCWPHLAWQKIERKKTLITETPGICDGGETISLITTFGCCLLRVGTWTAGRFECSHSAHSTTLSPTDRHSGLPKPRGSRPPHTDPGFPSHGIVWITLPLVYRQFSYPECVLELL